MAHPNPNTLHNFSQSWQRATHFRELDLQHEEISQPSHATETEKSLWGFEKNPYAALQHPISVADLPSYGTIGRCDQHVVTASTRLAGILEKGGDGRFVDTNRSTVPMTIFNCTNMLVGVGTLSLALGFQQCGWVAGLVMLTLPIPVTIYTAKLLVRCLQTDEVAMTYGDIAHLACGSIGRHFIEAIFASELIAANAALFILFASSLESLNPSLSQTACKIVVALGMIPLNFAPFKLLSVTSVVGIFSFIGVLTILTSAGLSKPDLPGSLIRPAHTSAMPHSWNAVATSIGIFVAPWGGHSIVPAVYRDMRHPQKYEKALKWTYSACYFIAMSMAVLGYLMFGDSVLPEITSNILSMSEYPRIIPAITLVIVTTIPLTKISLNNRPVLDTLYRKLGIHPLQQAPQDARQTGRGRMSQMMRLAVAVSCNLLELALAIAIPDFGDIVGLLGSACCITISIVLPACFYLRVCSKRSMAVSTFDRTICWMLIVVGTIAAVIGTMSMILKARRE